jgi:hypothetical protein
MIIGFLHRTFIKPNVRTPPEQELTSRLQDYLYQLGDNASEDTFAQSAGRWSSDDNGWLRKYYRENSDEPYFDITAATEKATDWLASLEQRQFIGTESRLLTVFALLGNSPKGRK